MQKWIDDGVALCKTMKKDASNSSELSEISKNAINKMLTVRTNMSLTYEEAKSEEKDIYRNLSSTTRHEIKSFFKNHNQKIARRRRRSSETQWSSTVNLHELLPEFLQDLDAKARSELYSIIQQPSLTVGQITERIKKWAKKQGGEIQVCNIVPPLSNCRHHRIKIRDKN